MDEHDHPQRVLDYSADRRRTSALAIVAAMVSILAFPVAILLTLTHAGRRPMDEGEVILEFLKTFLPLFSAEILAVRSLFHVLHSRRSSHPLRGLDFAIAAILFNTAWLLILGLATLASR